MAKATKLERGLRTQSEALSIFQQAADLARASNQLLSEHKAENDDLIAQLTSENEQIITAQEQNTRFAAKVVEIIGG